MHVIENVFHKGTNQAPPGILRVCGDAGDSAHIHDFIVDIDFHGINHNHRRQLIPVKPAKHESLFQNRAFGGLDFILFPSGLK